ncbi:hypothetical protein HQ40_03745 [Porphyromonas gulae]|uniref:Uncharacterized protein n=1 Tax=Porphyromonas gulae TaxID=111105 RepID=A0A0A2ECJ6_9PORP|nr:hypothetical protein HQ40_03745 [Porphyromonas gulae]KGN95803.1 hypothetical protein HR15_00035 [Porphyromonas gulae]
MIVRTSYFLIFFIGLWFTLTHIFSFVKEECIFLSSIAIPITWTISIGITFSLFLLYLFFVAKDRTFRDIIDQILPRGYDVPLDVLVRDFVVFLMFVFTIYWYHPSFYSHLNAIRREELFNGNLYLKTNEKNKQDGQFIWIEVKTPKEILSFEGKTNELKTLINKEVHIIVYQGLFSKYALVSQP